MNVSQLSEVAIESCVTDNGNGQMNFKLEMLFEALQEGPLGSGVFAQACKALDVLHTNAVNAVYDGFDNLKAGLDVRELNWVDPNATENVAHLRTRKPAAQCIKEGGWIKVLINFNMRKLQLGVHGTDVYYTACCHLDELRGKLLDSLRSAFNSAKSKIEARELHTSRVVVVAVMHSDVRCLPHANDLFDEPMFELKPANDDFPLALPEPAPKALVPVQKRGFWSKLFGGGSKS